PTIRAISSVPGPPSLPIGPRNPATRSCLARVPDSTVGLERSEEHTSELQSRENLVCRLLLEKKNNCGKDPKWQCLGVDVLFWADATFLSQGLSLSPIIILLYFSNCDRRALHSFPTRRSSDLAHNPRDLFRSWPAKFADRPTESCYAELLGEGSRLNSGAREIGRAHV